MMKPSVWNMSLELLKAAAASVKDNLVAIPRDVVAAYILWRMQRTHPTTHKPKYAQEQKLKQAYFGSPLGRVHLFIDGHDGRTAAEAEKHVVNGATKLLAQLEQVNAVQREGDVYMSLRSPFHDAELWQWARRR